MSKTGEGLSTAFGCAFMISIVGFGIIQLYAGWLGINHHLGVVWAGAAVLAALFLRFSLPITVGSFFGAMNVWGWHWTLALTFSAPGLVFMLLMFPGAMASVRGRGKHDW